MYKLVFVMSNKYGFGDNIKGLITCYLIAKINNLDFKVHCKLTKLFDISIIINNYFIDNSNILPNQPKKFIGNPSKSGLVRYFKFNLNTDILKENIYITTNIDPFYLFYDIWDKQIDAHNKNNYKFIYNVIDDINYIFLFKKIYSVTTKYDILHIRLGDKYFDSFYNDDINYKMIIETINENHINRYLVILSDNKNIIDQVIDNIKNKINYDIVISDKNSMHFNSIQNNDEYLVLLDDFSLFYNADIVYSYTWSGFSFYSSLLGKQNYVLIQ